jgi:hypothetical protein
MHRSRACFVAPALALSLLVTATGCGDDETATTTTTEAGVGNGAGHGSARDAVAVTAADYRYEGLPDELAPGTALALHNASAAEIHELVLLRLPDDETRSVDELLALPEGELQALFAAPPAVVLVAPPGEDGFAAVGTGAIPDPGRYVAMCFIPTGADPQAYLDALDANPGQPPAVKGGPPHFTAGMYQEVTVR